MLERELDGPSDGRDCWSPGWRRPSDLSDQFRPIFNTLNQAAGKDCPDMLKYATLQCIAMVPDVDGTKFTLYGTRRLGREIKLCL